MKLTALCGFLFLGCVGLVFTGIAIGPECPPCGTCSSKAIFAQDVIGVGVIGGLIMVPVTLVSAIVDGVKMAKKSRSIK